MSNIFNTAITFDSSDLGFIAQVAYSECARNPGWFDHLMEIAVEFEEMATGKTPATWERIAGIVTDYMQCPIDVMDDIMALLIDAEADAA